MASSSEARAARRARRLFCSARVWSGVSTTDALRSHVNKAIDARDYYRSCISKSKIAHSEEEADIRFVLSAIRKARISRVQLQQASVIQSLNTTQKRNSVPPVHVKTYILYITYTPNTGQ